MRQMRYRPGGGQGEPGSARERQGGTQRRSRTVFPGRWSSCVTFYLFTCSFHLKSLSVLDPCPDMVVVGWRLASMSAIDEGKYPGVSTSLRASTNDRFCAA